MQDAGRYHREYMDYNFDQILDILYGSYIKYDRLYEMVNFAFYGKTESNQVNIFIDIYSMVKSLYSRGPQLGRGDSCVIASCLINLAIHLRAYFETRHRVESKVYLIYGGARPKEAFINYYRYNEKNIIMEESDSFFKNMLIANLETMQVICPYLYNIFCIVDYEKEFDVIASHLIDNPFEVQPDKTPNVIYSRDPMSYQLVAFCPRTFLFRPKKSNKNDVSWVVTKSTIYDAYRYGELGMKKQVPTSIDYRMFSIFLSIAGVKSRSIPSIRNASTTLKLLEQAVANNIFANVFNSNSILYSNPDFPNAFDLFCNGTNMDPDELTVRFAAIDLGYQKSLYMSKPTDIFKGVINLYDPREVKHLNDTYFEKYPLDLNRV